MPDHLVASFEPSDVKLLAKSPNNQLLIDSPILASALSQIFPYLLLIDSVLEVVTWTNDDPYQNFLLLVLYSWVVMYWNSISYIILPILMSIFFSSVVWSVSSIIHDSKFEEKPTIDEVLNTLHNITIRSEMLLCPMKHVPFKFRNFVKFFIMTALLTPIHLLIVRTIIPPQKFVWFFGLFCLTYHSPWSFSIRRLLWRSVYIRIAAVYLTGLDIKIDRRYNAADYQTISRVQTPSGSDMEELNNVPLLSDFKIVKKSLVSPTQVSQIVLFELLENERRWIGLGWSKLLMPNERPSFCHEKSLLPAPSVETTKDDYPFPIFENDIYKYSWDWLDTDWKVDVDFNDGKSKEGWVYYDNKWSNPSHKDGFSKYTRSRKWIRKAILLIDKQETVHDA
ncbi:Pex24p integral peroxisomal membrane peroxin [Scheffersomyces xylosifermentans]|uniref:Pex24p integral peroxisomal membrane peroxin n=1 Tax=Scheffersomyces xylosifermentans TaxID=1304137 RepID=UPI00315DCC04